MPVNKPAINFTQSPGALGAGSFAPPIIPPAIQWSEDPTYKSASISLDETKTIATFNYVNAYHAVYSDIAITYGKWYWEFKCLAIATGGAIHSGFGINSETGLDLLSTNIGRNVNGSVGLGVITSNSVYRDNDATPFPDIKLPYLAAGNFYSVAYDADNGFIWFGHNGVWTDVISGTQGVPPAAPNYSSVNWNTNNMRLGLSSYRQGFVVKLLSKAVDFNIGTLPTGFSPLADAL